MIVLMLLFGSMHTIGNQWLSVHVTDSQYSVRPGSIYALHDNWAGREITGNGQFSGINTGSFIPADGEITFKCDTALTFHSTHFSNGVETLPLDLTVSYRVVDRGLEIAYRFEYLETTEFLSPLDIDFHLSGWDSIAVSNQTATDEVFALDGSNGFQRFSGDQLFRLSGDLPTTTIILPNVSKGMTAILDNPAAAYMSIRVLDTEPPRENATGPDLHSVIPAGQVDEYFIRISLDEYFSPLYISAHPDGGERSAGWMLDELTFVHPSQGYIWGFSETPDGDEPVSACLINLLEDHQQLKMNWLMLPDGILQGNRDSMWYEPGYYDSFSHWHSTWRFCTEATEEYLQWLRNIQNDVYPWADRVRMGSHGYHHTPSPDSTYGGFHEFITYEPEEHQERFRVHNQDLAMCGLDTLLVKVIRFSGHRTSLSGLQAVIDHGYTFYCNGWRLIDWYAGKQFRNQWITRYQTENGRIWGSNSVWWGDYQCMYPYEFLSEVMEKGKFGLLGCHPIAMFGAVGGTANPEAYARIDSVITSLENDYPNFIWLFPEEYGDYLEDCFSIRVNSIRGQGSQLSMSFTGAVPEGLTFCAELDPADQINGVFIDGAAIPWELRGGTRLFAVSSQLPYGDHTVTVDIDPLGIEQGGDSGFSINAVNPSATGLMVLQIRGLPENATGNLIVYDLNGRVVLDQQGIRLQGQLNASMEYPPGLYFALVETSGMQAVTEFVLLR